MGLKIRETSGIQRNLPSNRTNSMVANNMHQQAATTLSNSSNNVTNIGAQGCQDFKRGFKIGNSKHIPTLSVQRALKETGALCY